MIKAHVMIFFHPSLVILLKEMTFIEKERLRRVIVILAWAVVSQL
jgi:hypothetical protein